MKRPLQIVAILLVLLLCAAGFRVWDLAFHAPANNPQPLPANLIALDASEGKQLLSASTFQADYDSLRKNFESQSRPAFCGVASSVMTLNALTGGSAKLTQSAFFNQAAGGITASLHVTFGGMTLAQLADFLRAHNVAAKPYHAASTSLDAFRSILRQNLRTKDDYLLVNYERAVLGQGKTGHISPLAAYNADSDKVLILDVASYKYPPVWVSVEQLWQAMNTVDSSSGLSRGFVVVGGQ